MKAIALIGNLGPRLQHTARQTLALLSAMLLIASGAQAALSKALVGEPAPAFEETTLAAEVVSLKGLVASLPAGQSLHLVFLDALCPFPHFPGCEAKLQQLNKRVAQDTSARWLGIVNSYYVNEAVVRSFADTNQLSLPLVFDTDNSVVATYGVFATPYRVSIDAAGQIIYRGESLP